MKILPFFILCLFLQGCASVAPSVPELEGCSRVPINTPMPSHFE